MNGNDTKETEAGIMKRIIALLVALLLVLAQFGAFAEMGVQLISGPEEETEPISLDDIKLSKDVAIDGYGVITVTSFEYAERISLIQSNRYAFNEVVESGQEADYALLRMDIMNTNTTAKNYLATCEVSVTYDDVYEYGGWFYQYDYDRGKEDPADYIFDISPMYTGHYCFGCTLPNAVVNSKAPLKMIIKLDGNEITYNIRK